MKDSEIIAKAQELIRHPIHWSKTDWCSRASWSETGVDQFCIEGAVGEVLDLYDAQGLWRAGRDKEKLRAHAIIIELSQVAREIYPDIQRIAIGGKGSAQMLNDFSETTHEEVMALMDKTRGRLEEQGR